MSRRKIKIDDFSSALEKILDEYGESITDATREAVLESAKVAKQEVQSAAPVDTGKYQRGWAVKEEAADRLSFDAIVHNRTRYQLAHLLEHGHALRNGGRAPAIVHIKPAEEHAIENMEKAVAKIAKKG